MCQWENHNNHQNIKQKGKTQFFDTSILPYCDDYKKKNNKKNHMVIQ